jgi:hypothetical protein
MIKHLSSYVTLQLSFQMWTDQMQETLNSKKKGDTAFHQKNFKAAIENYTQVMFLLQLRISLQPENFCNLSKSCFQVDAYSLLRAPSCMHIWGLDLFLFLFFFLGGGGGGWGLGESVI